MPIDRKREENMIKRTVCGVQECHGVGLTGRLHENPLICTGMQYMSI